jgi:hypothetical protein
MKEQENYLRSIENQISYQNSGPLNNPHFMPLTIFQATANQSQSSKDHNKTQSNPVQIRSCDTQN